MWAAYAGAQLHFGLRPPLLASLKKLGTAFASMQHQCAVQLHCTCKCSAAAATSASGCPAAQPAAAEQSYVHPDVLDKHHGCA